MATRGMAVLLSGLLTHAWVAPAQASHLVDPEAVTARLDEARAARAENVAAVQQALRTPANQADAAAKGVTTETLDKAVARLSDAELADLAARAGQTRDVVAGHSSNDGLVIVGLVLLLAGLVVLAAVGDYDDYYYDDCYCY
jgi:hypothetical protein